MNIKMQSINLFSNNGLKSTQDRLDRQAKRDNQIAYFEQQKENLKDMKSDSIEDISRKLDLLHGYEDQSAAAKAELNNAQMFHVLDEARERAEKIAEEAEKYAPKTPEERLEDMIEEATGVDKDAGMLAEAMDELAEIAEEITEEIMDNSFSNNQIPADYQADSNDFSVVSKGTVLHGGIDTTGSIEINGVVEGNVKANGELILSGTITGNVEALIISVNAGKIRGNVKAYNGIYISEDSILIGDIESTEAEIGGAVKGKIDVNGPVVLKSDAKVLGDIDCKSVQINNGAVIEGKCSQKYAEISPSAFFENL